MVLAKQIVQFNCIMYSQIFCNGSFVPIYFFYLEEFLPTEFVVSFDNQRLNILRVKD